MEIPTVSEQQPFSAYLSILDDKVALDWVWCFGWSDFSKDGLYSTFFVLLLKESLESLLFFLHYLQKNYYYINIHYKENKSISKINYRSSEKKMCAVTKVAWAFELVTATDKLISINMCIITLYRNRERVTKYYKKALSTFLPVNRSLVADEAKGKTEERGSHFCYFTLRQFLLGSLISN